MRHIFLFQIILFCFLLSACGGETTSTPAIDSVDVPQATSTPTEVIETSSQPDVTEPRSFSTVVDGWPLEVVNMPPELALEFGAIIECRESSTTTELANDFLVAFAIRVLDENRWIPEGEATLIATTASGIPIEDYSLKFALAAGTVGWVVPWELGFRGSPLRGGNSKIGGFVLTFDNVSWQDVGRFGNEYQLDTTLVEHSFNEKSDFFPEVFPTSKIAVEITNESEELGLDKGTSLFAIIQDSKGRSIDLIRLRQGGGYGPGETKVLHSVPRSGVSKRCVGRPDNNSHTIHFWFDFLTIEDEIRTIYNVEQVEVDE